MLLHPGFYFALTGNPSYLQENDDFFIQAQLVCCFRAYLCLTHNMGDLHHQHWHFNHLQFSLHITKEWVTVSSGKRDLDLPVQIDNCDCTTTKCTHSNKPSSMTQDALICKSYRKLVHRRKAFQNEEM
jgi:hypothetical protein